MKDKKLDFTIAPIFNQSMPVWTEFLHIECACDEAIGYKYDENDAKRILSIYLSEWKDNKYSFAFGAYHANHMIGFTKGYLSQPGEAYIGNLYVLPKYQKKGVGTQLLRNAEKTSSLVADCVKLVSLQDAEDFYEKKNGYDHNGYDHIGGMTKNLSPFISGIVPVFQWIKRSFYADFKVKVDGYLLRENKHQPTFVHLNKYGAVDGVTLRTKDGKNKIWTDVYQNKCRYELLKALNNVK